MNEIPFDPLAAIYFPLCWNHFVEDSSSVIAITDSLSCSTENPDQQFLFSFIPEPSKVWDTNLVGILFCFYLVSIQKNPLASESLLVKLHLSKCSFRNHNSYLFGCWDKDPLSLQLPHLFNIEKSWKSGCRLNTWFATHLEELVSRSLREKLLGQTIWEKYLFQAYIKFSMAPYYQYFIRT